MTFEQAWEAARYNSWHTITFALMFGVSTAAGLTLAITVYRGGFKTRRYLLLLVCVALFFATAEAGVRSIYLKWDLRAASATTDQEREILAMRDTGNLAFAPFIAGFQGITAVLICTIATAIGVNVSRRRRVQGESPNHRLQLTGDARE